MAEAAAPSGVRNLYEKQQELVRKTFCKNEELLQAMSNIMLGTCKSTKEKGMLRATFGDPEVFEMVKRRFLPRLEDSIALGQAKDTWDGIELDIAARSPDQIRQFVEYKSKLIAMTEQAVELLRNPDGESVDLTVDPASLAADPLGSKIMARANYIKNVNNQITYLWIAGNQVQKEEKPVAGSGKAPKNPSGMPGRRG